MSQLTRAEALQFSTFYHAGKNTSTEEMRILCPPKNSTQVRITNAESEISFVFKQGKNPVDQRAIWSLKNHFAKRFPWYVKLSKKNKKIFIFKKDDILKKEDFHYYQEKFPGYKITLFFGKKVG